MSSSEEVMYSLTIYIRGYKVGTYKCKTRSIILNKAKELIEGKYSYLTLKEVVKDEVWTTGGVPPRGSLLGKMFLRKEYTLLKE